MTGAIISHFYWKTEHGHNSRYFINGSFFFIEPDLAITAYTILTDARSRADMVYAEDYVYFDSDIKHFDSENQKYGIQCIRLEKEWLKEFPEKNITEIHFPQPVSSEFFSVSKKIPGKGHHVICEGYNTADNLLLDFEPTEMNFVLMSKREFKRVVLFRQGAFIEDFRAKDCIYAEMLEIEKIDVLYTSCFPILTMIGGPILDFESNEVLGILSHETDDPYKSNEGLRGVLVQ